MSSEFSDSDFAKMMFNLRKNPDLDYREQFAEFKHFDEFSVTLPAPIDRNTLIRYVGFCYDKESPFRIKYKNLMERKVHAALEAGFSMKDDKFDKHFEDVLECNSPNTNNIILAYCRLHNSMTYRHLIVVEQMYYNREKDIFMNQTALKMSELRSIREEFDKTMSELLALDNSAWLVKSLYQSVNRERIALAPEDIAQKIAKNGYENALS